MLRVGRFTWVAILLLLMMALQLYGLNQLIVRRPTSGAFRVGYIDEAVLVVEPQGSHAEQSLYLHYSDHGSLGGSQIEVIHQFELPKDAVVNDLWLWMGDSVMQAVMMDRWRAKAIYDSILPRLVIDPALLIKTGAQYELHVYPLTSASYRKVKINYLAPVEWNNQQARVELPLGLLNANNTPYDKPLKILFRTRRPIWGEPSLEGVEGITFQSRRDTMGYQYRYAYIPNTAKLNKLVLTYQTEFTDGIYFRANQKQREPMYFLAGFHPRDLYDQIDEKSLTQKVLVGLDLSGNYRTPFSMLLENLNNVLKSAISSKEKFKLMVAGAGEMQSFPDDWISGREADAVLTTFAQSALGNKIANIPKPHVLFADELAYKTWGFRELDQIATWEKVATIKEAAKYFYRADVVAAYEHGYESTITAAELQFIRPRLDSLFARGGRFLTFFDSNRVSFDILSPQYISGLSVIHKSPANLVRNEAGNIGRFFPPTCSHQTVNFLGYSDPQAKTELKNALGEAAVISKKISQGLFVVSGIWAYKDDYSLRRDFSLTLLGLNHPNPNGLLLQLLHQCQQQFQLQNYDRLIVFTNADSIFAKTDADATAAQLLAGFGQRAPLIHTVNLIDLPFPLVSQPNNDYQGSGYFEYALAKASGGSHFETSKDDWDTIATELYYLPPLKLINFDVTIDNGAGQLLEMRPLQANDTNPFRPYFYVGAATGEREIKINLTAEFKNIDYTIKNQYLFAVDHDTTQAGQVMASIIGRERLQDLFKSTPLDTAAIVDLAMKFRLLCDFTALIALEPSKKYHFMKNPFDEGKMVPVRQHSEETPDSLRLDLYPNPFNDYVTVEVAGLKGAQLTLCVYNLKGQLVRTLAVAQPLVGAQCYSWDGRDDVGQSVASGIYFVHASLQQKGVAKTIVQCKRLLLLR